MLTNLFRGLFDTGLTEVISVTDFLLCIAVSLLAGVIIALSYTYKTRYTKSFVITLAMLPAIVCIVIMMVNGNIGAGVAVAGAFSLVRFRSVPGSAKEIAIVFLAMGTGLIAGMGYLAFATLFAIIMSLVSIFYSSLDFGTKRKAQICRTMNITIPEDLNYTEVFDEILQTYTSSYELIRVKTTNLGSMFRLTYDIVLTDPAREKEMIDALRCRNGNLEISVCRQETELPEL